MYNFIEKKYLVNSFGNIVGRLPRHSSQIADKVHRGKVDALKVP
jgi:hypothetical protein